MLSVLIPVKDWNPIQLVRELDDQLTAAGVRYEILVSDDSQSGHRVQYVDELPSNGQVTCFHWDQPLGRSANRNFLADQAVMDYLLFIDGDAGLENPLFIRNYLDALSPNLVLCGGTLYKDDPPSDKDQILRWKFGRYREQTRPADRGNRGWKSFSTFNFVISRSIFLGIRLDESIKGYGHEDTILGIRLHQAGIDIRHLDNGLLHLGLESAASYLAKTRESAANLKTIYDRGLLPDEYIGYFKLLKAKCRIEKLNMVWFISLLFRLTRKPLEKHLCGHHPSLLLLDFYKLGSIIQIA